MQIFISWSGEAARRCAEVLRGWLPYMNQAITPFVSSQDIVKGERGLAKIADELQACSFGVVCVTRENQYAPWINFESGALSRSLGESSLIPFLVDMQVKDLSSGPLTQFQATDSSNKDDVWAMVEAINGQCEPQVGTERLRTVFDRFWDDLAVPLSSIRDATATADVPQREVSDILDELVKLVREQHVRIGSLEKVIGNAGVTNTTSHYTINEPKEVRITGETDDQAGRTTQRNLARRVGVMVQEIIGRSHVESAGISGGANVKFTCTEEGVVRAHAASDKLASLATDYRVGITIRGPEGVEGVSYPAF